MPFKNLFSKKDKTKSNIVPVEEQKNVQQQVKEEKIKSSNKVKFANAIAKQLNNYTDENKHSDKTYVEIVSDIGYALISLPPNVKDDKYGFVTCTQNNQYKVQALLQEATKGNQPKTTDISCHYLYALRKKILEVFQYKSENRVISYKESAYYRDLAKLFKSAAKHSTDYKVFRPLIGHESLQQALRKAGELIETFHGDVKASIAYDDQRELYTDIIEYIDGFESNMCDLFKKLDKSQQTSNKKIVELKTILENLNKIAMVLKKEYLD